MTPPEKTEARILRTHNLLIVASKLEDEGWMRDFCGAVLTADDLSPGSPSLSGKTVYLCGDLSRIRGLDLTTSDLATAERVLVIKELSPGDHEGDDGGFPRVELGQVPLLVHGVGVYYRRFFDLGSDYFHRICAEHAFQSLTESTKPAKAHRTGIYLTPVTRDGEGLRFHLLRCSTNLSGPTENFRATDRHVVDALNQEAARVFQGQAPLNHVLAQIYHNTPATAEHKQSKAKISAHADKTKDMPSHGIMAFCTFYDRLDKLRPLAQDPFDHGHQGISGLTRLRFRLKEAAGADAEGLPAQFTLTLYPNSVFFMPLSTNRLYTHEIVSPALDAERLPTRLGYVVRCSSTEAVHKDGHTFLERGGARVKLEPPTPEGMEELRRLYAEENKSTAFIDYGDRFLFSMNGGDYLAPEYKVTDELRAYTLPAGDNPFAELCASVGFEQVGKGRRGAVLVKVPVKVPVKGDEERGAPMAPIVRTTTRYGAPAQPFRPAHERLAQQIRRAASLSTGFNNALIEVYTSAYTTMGSHSDQALDLAEDSFIAVYSCYQHPEIATPPRARRLIVESKEPGGEVFEIPLIHNNVVVFSVEANRRFKHKIVLGSSAGAPENEWLGITFRTSKTWVRFRGGHPYLSDVPEDTRLWLADEEQKREFYQLRRRENEEVSFRYPWLTYTLSESDLMPPAAWGEGGRPDPSSDPSIG